MTTRPCTYQLGSLGWLAKQAQIPSPIVRLRLMLFTSASTPTFATMVAQPTVGDMVTQGAVEAAFSGYTAGGKILVPGTAAVPVDFAITTNTGTRVQQLGSFTQQSWNPGGGAVNQAMKFAVLAAQLSSADVAYGLWLPLGVSDDAIGGGSTTGAQYRLTFGNLPITGAA